MSSPNKNIVQQLEDSTTNLSVHDSQVPGQGESAVATQTPLPQRPSHQQAEAYEDGDDALPSRGTQE